MITTWVACMTIKTDTTEQNHCEWMKNSQKMKKKVIKRMLLRQFQHFSLKNKSVSFSQLTKRNWINSPIVGGTFFFFFILIFGFGKGNNWTVTKKASGSVVSRCSAEHFFIREYVDFPLLSGHEMWSGKKTRWHSKQVLPKIEIETNKKTQQNCSYLTSASLELLLKSWHLMNVHQLKN